MEQVTTSNVGKLGLAWSKVVAMNGVTGQKKWEHDPKAPSQTAVNGCCDVVNRLAGGPEMPISEGMDSNDFAVAYEPMTGIVHAVRQAK